MKPCNTYCMTGSAIWGNNYSGSIQNPRTEYFPIKECKNMTLGKEEGRVRGKKRKEKEREGNCHHRYHKVLGIP